MYYLLSKFHHISLKNGWSEKAEWYKNAIGTEYSEISHLFGLHNVNKDDEMKKYNNYLFEILIPVYNSLEEVKLCIESIKEYTDEKEVRIIILNDASNREVTEYLRVLFMESSNILLIENSINLSYTVTINRGLKLTKAKYIVLLNSDTIVTRNWLNKLVDVFKKDENIGLVGPLSNAATWQTVPKLRDENNFFMVNELPNNYTVDSIQQLLDINSLSLFPNVELLNGFCMMIRQDVIATIGYMDEISFPLGYGEETDYCIRAREAGYKLCLADNVYIYHSKSKSFGDEKRKQLSYYGEVAIKYKYGSEEYSLMKTHMNENEELNKIRNYLSKLLKEK